MPRIAINGFGRIGRNILRAIYENNLQNEFQVVAINDVHAPEMGAHLLKFDTAHGTLNFDVQANDSAIIVSGNEIPFSAEQNPAELPWKAFNIDIVFECTGLFTARDKAARHLEAGAKKVLISAPSEQADITSVYGVNHQNITAAHKIISNASCTTNCLAPMSHALHEAIGIESGLMNTIHAYTNDQKVTDTYHSDPRRARAAAHNIIPTKTGAAAAIGLVIPALKGKLDGLSVRVPTINVSCLDLTFVPSRPTSAEEVNDVIAHAIETRFKGIMEINTLPLVSSDFKHNPASCIFDATQTRTQGNLVKVMAWYDNEWGFSNRMLNTARVIAAAQ